MLGKQGSIVTRIRDSTGAMVRVLEQNKGQRRLDTGEEVDEVIELQGSAGSCDAALHAAAKLLRDYQVEGRTIMIYSMSAEINTAIFFLRVLFEALPQVFCAAQPTLPCIIIVTSVQ